MTDPSSVPDRPAAEPDDTVGIEQSLPLDVGWAAEAVSFTGPLPPPGLMAQYQRLVPDAPERLFRMLEQTHERARVEQEHRHKVEDQELKMEKRGQNMAGFFTGVLILAAIFMALAGRETVGVAIFGTTIAGVGAVFYVARRDRRA